MRRRQPFPLEEDSEEPLINLTPLIDVVFVLLITFMLIAPILNVDHVDLATKGESNQTQASSSPIAITIRADNTLWFRGKLLDIKSLEALLKEEKKLHPGTCPQLIADKNSRFGLYQDVKNSIENCGFQQMDVLLQ